MKIVKETKEAVYINACELQTGETGLDEDTGEVILRTICEFISLTRNCSWNFTAPPHMKLKRVECELIVRTK